MNRRNFLQAMAISAGGLKLGALTRDHVIVAGAGIIGASLAYHLAKRGARVTVLEKEHPAAGTTKNSFAWLNAASKSPRSYYELNLAGIAGWRRLQQEIGASMQVQWGGGVQWCRPEDKLTEAMKQHVRERQTWGYSIALIDEGQLAQLIPYATPGEIGAANFADQEGTVDPVAAAETLIAKAREFGAEVVYPCEVKEIETSAGRVRGVLTSQGLMEADCVVLATGNATMTLAAQAGINVPLKESKGILAHSRPRTHFLSRVLMPPGCDVKQNPDGRIVTGTNFGDTGEMQATKELGRAYLEAAAQYLPLCQGAEVDYMTLGYRVMPKDEYPIIGRSAKLPNLYVAAMHSGMTMAPIVGQLASLEILDQVTVDVLQPYRMERF